MIGSLGIAPMPITPFEILDNHRAQRALYLVKQAWRPFGLTSWIQDLQGLAARHVHDASDVITPTYSPSCATEKVRFGSWSCENVKAQRLLRKRFLVRTIPAAARERSASSVEVWLRWKAQ
ncbi:MAG: hypothetical protein ACTS5I_06530 [Rhodanobacter sp.]